MKLNWRFWLHLVLDPLRTLDLTDSKGNPDHGKVLPAILLFAAIIAQFLNQPFAVGSLIVLGSLSYGYGAWRAFLKSKTVTSTEVLTHNKTEISQKIEQILSRRDVAEGVDPTYE